MAGPTDKRLFRAFAPEPEPPNPFAAALTRLGPSPRSTLLGFGPEPTAPTLGDILNENYRRRSEWNDRFSHWEKPASVTEEGTIERAHAKVVSAISTNDWLRQQNVTISPQGSYHNNTNVRTEADIDLRAVHPSLKIEYGFAVVQDIAYRMLSYGDYGLTFGQIFTSMRAEMTSELARKFGAANIVPGKKAIRIKGITGSRAEVDLVPAVKLHYVEWYPHLNRYNVTEGVAIFSTESRWTLNFPEQHSANGVIKRGATSHRFKRIVRVFKRLRADMMERGLLAVKVPSFLVECLVYIVENEYFLVESDDGYDRVRRVALRMQELLNSPAATSLREINGIKLLFHSSEAWTLADARTFVNAVVIHLGDC